MPKQDRPTDKKGAPFACEVLNCLREPHHRQADAPMDLVIIAVVANRVDRLVKRHVRVEIWLGLPPLFVKFMFVVGHSSHAFIALPRNTPAIPD